MQYKYKNVVYGVSTVNDQNASKLVCKVLYRKLLASSWAAQVGSILNNTLLENSDLLSIA